MADSSVQKKKPTLRVEELQLQEEPPNLPAIDTSPEAWKFAIAASVLELLAFGYSYSYGILQSYMLHPTARDAKLALFQNPDSLIISAVGTIGAAIQYIIGVFLEPLYRSYPSYIKPSMWISLGFGFAAFILSSFATRMWHLIILQSVIFGVFSASLYMPVIVWLSDWFVRRRAMASGITFAGNSVGGLVYPLVFRFMLEKLGYQNAMRVYGCSYLALGALVLPYVRPRIKHSGPNPGFRMPSFAFCKDPVFLLFAFSVLAHRMAYTPISIGISSHTLAFADVNESLAPTLTLILLNAAAIPSSIILGWCSDKFDYWYVTGCVGVGSALSVSLVLGFAQRMPGIYAFVVCCGLSAGGYSAVWTAAAKGLADNKHPSGLIFLMFSVFGGVGILVGPVVVDQLQGAGTQISQFGTHGYSAVIFFLTGVFTVMSLLMLIYLVCGWQSRQPSLRRALPHPVHA